MTNEEKKRYLNSFLGAKEAFQYGGPKSLFKFRPFDAFAFDMFENEYLYLCPAEREDDKTECDVSFDVNDYYDIQNDHLKPKCIEYIFQQAAPATTKEKMQEAKARVACAISEDGDVDLPLFLDCIMDCQALELLPPEVCTDLVNRVANIPNRVEDPRVKADVEMLFLNGLNAKQEVGICSLCESMDNPKMWELYAENGSGYCVEYDVSDYEYNIGLFPVIYDDQRETNLVLQILGNFIGQLITGISNGAIDADKSQFMRLFLTKDPKQWGYQKEWRLFGGAGERMPAPRIKAVYIGENCSDDNKKSLKDVAARKGFQVVEKMS